MNRILCKKCATWVDCGEKEGKPFGFCVQKDFFTYTAESECPMYLEGTPISGQEFENYNSGAK